MSYFEELYKEPLKKTFQNWKKIITTFIFEFFIVSIVVMLSFLLEMIIFNLKSKVQDHDFSTEEELFLHAFEYMSEMESFLQGFYIAVSLFVITVFLIYTLSRTLVWSKLLGIKITKKLILRNFSIDFVFAILALLFYLFITNFVRPQLMNIFFILLGVPLLIYSFLVHLNMKKNFKEVFKINLEEVLLFFPHIILITFIGIVFLNTSLGLLPFILVLSFFRIFYLSFRNKV